MRVTRLALPEVILLEPKVFRDPRGFFVETYRRDRLWEVGIHDEFVQDNHSRSMRGTLRGMHWQWRRPQAKLVQVLSGRIFDVAVDVRRGSATFGRWVGLELEADPCQVLYVPAGFAHGFAALSEQADVEYKCSAAYDPDGEAGFRWDDPLAAIEWPLQDPLLSARDASHPPLTPDRHDLLDFQLSR